MSFTETIKGEFSLYIFNKFNFITAMSMHDTKLMITK